MLVNFPPFLANLYESTISAIAVTRQSGSASVSALVKSFGISF